MLAYRRLQFATLGGIAPATYDCDFTTLSTLTNVTDKGWTYSRTGLATYVDSTGTVVYNNHNLLPYSSSYGAGTSWALNRTTETANATTDPLGGNTASRIVETSSFGEHQVLRNVSSPNTSYVTLSCYAKKDQRSFVTIASFLAANNYAAVSFDLTNGVAGTVAYGSSATVSGGVATITNIGNGWYRCSLAVIRSLGTVQAYFGIATGLNPAYSAYAGETYAGNTANGLFLWGCQLEQNYGLRTYIPTTTAQVYWPRLRSDNGILLEQGQTNLLNWSETFAASGGTNNNWVTFNMTTSTGSTSPNGVTTSVKFLHDGTNPGDASVASTAAIGTTARRALSVYVRRVTGTGNVWYSLDNGTTKTNFAGLTSSWQRYRFTETNANHQVAFGLATVGDEVEFWGAQLETAGTPSEYISTANAQVARATDSMEMLAAQATFLSASAGTLIFEGAWTFAYAAGGATASMIRIGQGGVGSCYYNGRFTSSGTTTGSFTPYWQYNPTQTQTGQTTTFVIEQFRKAGFKYVLGTTFTGVISGSVVATTAPSASMTTMDKIDLFCYALATSGGVGIGTVPVSGTARYGGGWIRRVRYWNSALSDADMTTLTT